MALNEFTKEQLREEIKRREEEEEKKATRRRKENGRLVLKNVDTLLELTPEHTGYNCSDEKLERNSTACPRCFLLRTKRDNYFDEDFSLQIKIVREVEEDELDAWGHPRWY